MVQYLTDRRQRPSALTGRPDCDCRRINSRLAMKPSGYSTATH
jgi:hypothetical protein